MVLMIMMALYTDEDTREATVEMLQMPETVSVYWSEQVQAVRAATSGDVDGEIGPPTATLIP